MSKFLKFLVNLFLICSIIVTASLLIPPLAGVTTNIIDTVNMDTNLPFGSVTYSKDVTVAELAEGDKVLVDNGNSIYVYTVQSGDASTGEFTVLDAMDKSSEASQVKLRNPVYKVVLTVPFTGYVVVAMQSAEGFIIIILVLVFVAILFVLSELWKKSDDDEEEEEEEEEHRETRKERKARLKAEKEAEKEAERQEAEAKKAARKAAKAAPAKESAGQAKEASAQGDFSEVGNTKVTQAKTGEVIPEAKEDFTELPEDDVKIYSPKPSGAAAAVGGAATIAAGAAASGSSAGTADDLASIYGRRALQSTDGARADAEALKSAETPAVAGAYTEVETSADAGAQPAGGPETEEPGSKEISLADSLFPETTAPETVIEEQPTAAADILKPAVESAEAASFTEMPETTACAGAPEAYEALFPTEEAPKPVKEEAPAAQAVTPAAEVQKKEEVRTPAHEAPAAEAAREPAAAAAAGAESQMPDYAEETTAPQDPDHFTPVDRPTLEEIVEQARKKGLNPEIRRDSITNVNLVDFSQFL